MTIMKANDIRQKLIELGAWDNYQKEYDRQLDEEDPTTRSATEYLEFREKWAIKEGGTSIDDDFFGFYKTILLSFNWDESEKGEEYWEKIAETYPSREILEERREEELVNGNRLINAFMDNMFHSYDEDRMFHDSWDWLIRVVSKIVEQSNSVDFPILIDAILHNNIDTAWTEVVRIIQFIQSKNN